MPRRHCLFSHSAPQIFSYSENARVITRLSPTLPSGNWVAPDVIKFVINS